MQRVIISGASGFLGSSLAKAFLDNGYNVSALVRTTSNVDRLESVLNNPNFKLYRLNEDADLNLAINWENIDVAIHTATNYGRNNQDAHSVFMANEDFALRFLEAASKNKLKAFINTDSFFNTEEIIYDNLLYYATSKKNFMDWGKVFANRSQIKFINVKLFHMYGFGDGEDKFIDHVIRALVLKIPQLDLTKGEQKRDFISVKDVISAYLFIVSNFEKISANFIAFDLGVGSSTSIKGIVEKIKKLSRNNVTKLNFGVRDYAQNEIMDSQANIDFLKSLGWKPKISLEEGLIEYIQQYKAVNNVL